MGLSISLEHAICGNKYCSFFKRCVFLYRDNGLKAIENLMQKKGKFDYILLETTGLADPGRYD